MLLNQQQCCSVRLSRLRSFEQLLRCRLRLGRREFNVCLVDDRVIRRLNHAFRGKARSTDVLSFPWMATSRYSGRRAGSRLRSASPEFRDFLGDVVISVETARRNARREGHATLLEVRWLMLHGVLHLLGYDHETDGGEMTALELDLRERLGAAGVHGRLRGR